MIVDIKPKLPNTENTNFANKPHRPFRLHFNVKNPVPDHHHIEFDPTPQDKTTLPLNPLGQRTELKVIAVGSSR